MSLRSASILLLLLCLSPIALCALVNVVNVSIDDTLGQNGNQISYTPSDKWELGQTCIGCTAVLDASQPFDHTWHDSSYTPESIGGDGIIRSASVSFNGTAVYVYCILASSLTSPDGNTDMVFFLDGDRAGEFERPPDGNPTYLYNQVVFSRTGLASGMHSLQIDVGHNNTKALILLDRIVYTTDISDPSSTSTTLPKLTITEVTSSSTSTPGPANGGRTTFHVDFLSVLGYVLSVGAICLW